MSDLVCVRDANSVAYLCMWEKNRVKCVDK
jgi:hypothetical protein